MKKEKCLIPMLTKKHGTVFCQRNWHDDDGFCEHRKYLIWLAILRKKFRSIFGKEAGR